jgi:ABC-type multidrug transport system fused ATPase/permease subunit
VTPRRSSDATRELRRDCTSFIIVQRLSTISDAVLLLVIHAGRIVERDKLDKSWPKAKPDPTSGKKSSACSA